MTLEEKEQLEVYFYAKARGISMMEAAFILRGFADQFMAFEQRKRRQDFYKKMHNITSQNLEEKEQEFSAEHYRHPFLLKPTLYKVVGLDSAKQALHDHAKHVGISTSPCLLYGPPKCGKKTTINLFANESNRALYIYPAVSQKRRNFKSRVEELCKVYNRARDDMNPIFVFDRIETCLSGLKPEESEAFVSLLGRKITAAKHRIPIFCTSSQPWKVDPRILEHFGARIHVGLPSQDSIQSLWENQIEQVANLKQCSSCEKSVPAELYGCSAEGVLEIAFKAGKMAKAEQYSAICRHHMDAAIDSSQHVFLPKSYLKQMTDWKNDNQNVHDVLYWFATGWRQ